MLSLCPVDISVGVGAFVIGLSQISSFFSSKFASTKVDDSDLPNPNVKDYTVRELHMVAEQAKDDTIQKLKTKLENGDASPAVYNVGRVSTVS